MPAPGAVKEGKKDREGMEQNGQIIFGQEGLEKGYTRNTGLLDCSKPIC